MCNYDINILLNRLNSSKSNQNTFFDQMLLYAATHKNTNILKGVKNKNE